MCRHDQKRPVTGPGPVNPYAPAARAEEGYASYLQSPHWLATREWALERSRRRCEECGARGVDVHHLTYDRVGAELPGDLIVLCRRCHDYAHAEPLPPQPPMWACRICGQNLIPFGLTACGPCWERTPDIDSDEIKS